MLPNRELLVEALPGPPGRIDPLGTDGYTQSRAWRVETPSAPVFVKEAEEKGSLHMLRREAVVYGSVEGEFLPAFVGFVDDGDRALLAIEFLAEAHWPPPYPADVTPLFRALELVATTRPPVELPAYGEARASRWERVATAPEPFLGLGVCSPTWLASALDVLASAERRAVFDGTALVHNDVYAANVGFTPGGTVLVDWGAAMCGSPSIDVAFALLSVRVEGGTAPADVDLPDEGLYAAALAGMLATEAPLAPPDWAKPGSTLREDMTGDLRHALLWAAEQLDLAPP